MQSAFSCETYRYRYRNPFENDLFMMTGDQQI
jgi:hypothetical protein